jgi:hypothetical protein
MSRSIELPCPPTEPAQLNDTTGPGVNPLLFTPRAAALNEKNQHGNKQNSGNNSGDHDTVHREPSFSQKQNRFVGQPERARTHSALKRRSLRPAGQRSLCAFTV